MARRVSVKAIEEREKGGRTGKDVDTGDGHDVVVLSKEGGVRSKRKKARGEKRRRTKTNDLSDAVNDASTGVCRLKRLQPQSHDSGGVEGVVLREEGMSATMGRKEGRKKNVPKELQRARRDWQRSEAAESVGACRHRRKRRKGGKRTATNCKGLGRRKPSTTTQSP
jgi:hypothetical protein